MKSLSLSTRMIAASVVLAALVAGVFAVLIYAVVTLDNARARAEAATKDVRTALVGLEKLVIDLESGLRGVVLTGNPRFLQPARGRRQVDRRAGELERLVADNPTQLQRVRNCVWRSTATSVTTWSPWSALPRRTLQPSGRRWPE